MEEMKLQEVFDTIGGNLDELNAKIENTAKGGDTIKRKYVIADLSLPPATQFGGLELGEMAAFSTATANVPGGPWSGSSVWGYVVRTHAEYYFMFATRVDYNQIAYRSSDLAGSGTWKPWVIDDGTGVAESAKKLATGRTIQTDLASTAAATFDGSANVAPGVTGILPVARGGTGNATGNAASATKLATARNFSISGGATAAAKGFDGSGAVELAVTGLDVGKANAGTLPVARGGTGNTTGNAASATKLATGRAIQTDLASTAAATFDGSANVAPGVTGILPVARGGTGNATGNAASATKLATARNFSISGGATAAAKGFDGSGAVELAVTGLDVGKANAGILPVARGGTGNTTGNAATATKLATARKINGVEFDGTKDISITASATDRLPLAGGTMTGQIRHEGSGGTHISGGAGNVGFINVTNHNNTGAAYPILRQKVAAGAFVLAAYQNAWRIDYFTNDNINKNSNTVTNSFVFGNDGALHSKIFAGALNGNATTATRAQNNIFRFGNDNAECGYFGKQMIGMRENKNDDGAGFRFGVVPNGGAVQWALHTTNQNAMLGSPGYRWSAVWSSNGSIQTSDRNEKNTIEDVEEDLATRLIMGLSPKTYKMNAGTSGRTHWGLIAQEVEDLLDVLGISSRDFAGLIKARKTKEVWHEEVDEETGEVENVKEDIDLGEDTYSLRYDEFLSPLIAVVQRQERRIDELQQEVELLKGR